MPSVQDFTSQFNADEGITLDVGGSSSLSIQFVGASGTIAFKASNSSDEDDFVAVEVIDVEDGTEVTTGGTGVFKVDCGFKYFFAGGASAAATKVLVYFK